MSSEHLTIQLIRMSHLMYLKNRSSSSAFTFSNQIHKGSALEELPNDQKEVNSFYAFIVDMSKQFSNMYKFWEKRHEQEEREFQCDAGHDSFAS